MIDKSVSEMVAEDKATAKAADQVRLKFCVNYDLDRVAENLKKIDGVDYDECAGWIANIREEVL